MISKLDIKDYKDKEQLVWFGIINKINELVDAVNEIMTWRFETDEDSDWYDDPKYREQPADNSEKANCQGSVQKEALTMSSIWHTELNDFEKEQPFCCLFFTKSEPKTLYLGYYNPCTQKFGNYMNHERYSYYEIERFAYIENLLELEKTQKQLAIAIDWLKEIKDTADDALKPVLDQCLYRDMHDVQKLAEKALEQITTLEQKD